MCEKKEYNKVSINLYCFNFFYFITTQLTLLLNDHTRVKKKGIRYEVNIDVVIVSSMLE